MFIVGLGDGLGNQMFQYAFYLALRKHYIDSTVLFDKDYFYGSVNKHNGIELERIFGLTIPQCTRNQALVLCDYHTEIKKQHPFMSVIWLLRKIIYGSKQSYISVDDETAFYKEVFELNPLHSYYLRGNWINPKYFENCKAEIQNAFQFPEISDDKNKKILEEIKSTESVSIHLRAGDYLTNPGMDVLERDYYEKALNIIREKVGQDIDVFIFSDDKLYVAKLFKDIEDKTIITYNTGENSYKDMQLMASCKHNIIANSTFGFWGAYLNDNPNKLVIAPKKATKNCRYPFACDSWTLI